MDSPARLRAPGADPAVEPVGGWGRVGRSVRRAVGAGPVEDAAPPGPAWIVWRWLATRLLAFLILVPERNILGDVRYYGRQLDALFGPAPVTDVLREYPAPALAVFVPPWWAALADQGTYLVTFVLLMVAIDAAFTAALWRASGRRPTPGVRVWLWLVPALGPLTFTRFDLVSAALAGGGLLALAARRPVAAGLATAAGAAVKLWPAALLPALLLRRDRPVRVLAAFAGLGAVAVAATVAGGGTARLLSPLTWQGERGLQIETIWAVPLLWGRAVSPHTWSTPYTRFYAFQVEGPGAAALTRLSTVATVAAMALLGWLWWRAWRSTRRPAAPASLALVGLLALAAAGLLILPNKTLSPQYLLWIGGLLAALGAVVPDEPLLPRLSLLVVVSCVLTQVLYPLGYGMLTGPHWSNGIGAALLTARNGLLVAVTVLVIARVVRLTRRP